MDFKSPYNRDQYINFFHNQLLPEDFEKHDEEVHLSFQPQHIRKVFKIGEVRSLPLTVYEIEHESENDPRVSLSRDSFRFMAHYGVQKALILFTSKSSMNYRLSLVTIDLKWEEGKKIEKEYSNPRRYSFFLGPDTKTHTPEEYLIKEGRVRDFNDLKKRFSIEVVNKAFYTHIAILFTRLAGGKRKLGKLKFEEEGTLKLPSTSDDTLKKEFSVRLIGRLVFCWFLKKKSSDKGISLLPEELLSSDAVAKTRGFYHSILEPLFFQVLNTPIDDRDDKYKAMPWSQVPFLNGGLFTPGNHDFYTVDKLGTSKHLNTLIVPDQWLKELFDVFETYNFTIDENTSVDVELSIEPEMLGRIFENLLAEINPETGETARKATGSYYTPRPIVEYMVDQSLKQYLLSNIPPLEKGGKGGFSDENTISKLLSYEDWDIELTDKEKDSILDALDNIKIIDPACGSGAFPMGILHKMLLILQKIDPESKKWLSKKIANVSLRKSLDKKIKDESWDYFRKRGIIQDSIYGVDIQPIAVEISKLRFFLSLVVDEKINEDEDNRGIEPLPNLEFKFVAANSLIGLPKFKKEETVGLFEATDEIKKLKELRDSYFTSYGEEKKRIENEFEETQKRMFQHSIDWQTTNSQTMKLSQWSPFSDEAASWFDPEWMFGVKDGFDVVIANPPYGISLSKEMKNLFETFVWRGESYIVFIEKGVNLLSRQGEFSYIVPDTYLNLNFTQPLRNYLLRNSLIRSIVVLPAKVFDFATVDTTLLFVRHADQSKEFHEAESTVMYYSKQANPFDLSKPLRTFSISTKEWYEQGIFNVQSNKKEIVILSKADKNNNPLSAYAEMFYGIKVYQVGKGKPPQTAHIRDTKPYTSDVQIDSSFLPFYDGKHIGRYSLLWKNNNWLKYGQWLAEPRNPSKFEGEKILIRKIIGRTLIATYIPETSYCNTLLYVLKILKNVQLSYKFLLGVLNSHFVGWYFRKKFQISADDTFPQIMIGDILKIPIPEVALDEQQNIVKLVTKILSLKQEDINSNTKEYEQQIDEMVYSLYNLTSEEIAIVEGKR